MHALEWIEQHGRRMRLLNATYLRKQLERQKGECTWCAGPVGKGRHRWCSKKCVDEFMDRCHPGHIRSAVKRRDKGICAACGLDTIEALKLAREIRRHIHEPLSAWRRTPWLRCQCIGCRLTAEYSALWEADHIVPVVEGGGLCGLVGYRTLCGKCHKSETAKLRRRMAGKPELKVVEVQGELFV